MIEEEDQLEAISQSASRLFPIFSRVNNATRTCSKETLHPSKRKRNQEDAHYCLACKKTLSRGNLSTRLRHTKSVHKNDKNYNHNVEIVAYDHERSVAVRKNLAQTTTNDNSFTSNNTSNEPNVTNISKNSGDFVMTDATEQLQQPGDLESEIDPLQLVSSTAIMPIESAPFVSDIESEGSLASIDNATFSSHPSNSSQAHTSTTCRQSTLPFATSTSSKPQEAQKDKQLCEITTLLGSILQKINISHEEEKLNPPSETANVLAKLKCASSISDIDGTGFEFFAGVPHEGVLVRCKICFDRLCENNPKLLTTDPAKAEKCLRISNKDSNSLASGLFVTKSKMEQLLQGQNQVWYTFKKMLIDHAGCSTTRNGGISHYQSIVWQKRKNVIRNTLRDVVTNQLSLALLVVKIKAAALHYESTISFLHSCGAEVGNIGHGRKQFNQMLRTFQVHIWKKTKTLLTNQLLSTGLPPHFATASDKSTPLRTTNHAVMVLVMQNGKRTAIPINAPPVYQRSRTTVGEIDGGTAAELASQVISALCESSLKLPQTQLSFLVAHHADGQYQYGQFRDTLLSCMQHTDESFATNREMFFVTPWDTSHWLDLSMIKVRDNLCRKFFHRLIKRANKFNNMFGRGKGLAEYEAVKDQLHLSGSVAKTYATTRFTSSAFEQFENIYKSYEALIRAYEETRETEDDCDETKYQVKGRDFCIDLCGILDCLTPFKLLMVKCQDQNTPLWSITKWWPKVRDGLSLMTKNLTEVINAAGLFSPNPDLFPKLSKHHSELFSNDFSEISVFQNVELQRGWLVESTLEDGGETRGRKKMQTIVWKEREPLDCLEDIKSVCDAVYNCTEERYSKCVSKVAVMLGKCFDVADIVSLMCGRSGKFTAMQKAKLRKHGREEFAKFYEYVCSLPQVKRLAERNSELSLDASCSDEILHTFHCVIFKVIWENLGDSRSEWFVPQAGCFGMTPLKGLKTTTSKNPFEETFLFEFESSSTTAVLNLSAVFKSFYVDEEIYTQAGQEFCIAQDVALAMGGCEAVVESYYSLMKAQTMPGGQANESLVQRANVDWCFPMPVQCRNTIKELSSLYLDGDTAYNLPRHNIPVFVDPRGRAIYKEGSKVLDRLSKPCDSFVLVASDKKY